jgi:hypothetical protein
MKKKLLKSHREKYRKYLFSSLLIFLTYLFGRILLDAIILLETDRIVGTADWLDVMLKTKAKLVSQTEPNSKRILIVSGSNALLGISAKSITQATGIKTINLGSHAGLGGEYILSWTEKFVRKDDIVLMPLEYDLYESAGMSDDFVRFDVLNRFLISYDRNSLQKISSLSLMKFSVANVLSGKNWQEYIKYLSGQLTKDNISKKSRRYAAEGKCYTALSFNEYGDETCNNNKAAMPLNPGTLETAIHPSMSDIDPGGHIKKFVKNVTSKGAKIIPLYPVATYTDDYQKPTFLASAANIKNFWLSQNIEFTDLLENALLPPVLMYDTKYHPTESGRVKRTESIIALLKNSL